MNHDNRTNSVPAEAWLLDKALAAYAAPVSVARAGARKLLVSGAGTVFQAVLTEVGQTLLPRQLVFLAEDGRSLSLYVAERHVLGASLLSAGSLARAIETELLPVWSMITEFALTDRSVSVRAQRAPTASLATIGLSVSSLLHFKPRGREVGASIIVRFMRRLGQIPTAWLLTDEFGEQQIHGDAAALISWQSELRIDDEPDVESDDQLIILAGDIHRLAENPSKALLIVHADSAQLLCSFDATQTFAVASLWLAEKRGAD